MTPTIPRDLPPLTSSQLRALDFIAQQLLTAPFRAVGPREKNRVLTEIVHDSLAPLLFEILPGEFATVFDLGCGSGIPTLPLAVMCPHLSFTGIDSTEKKISWAKMIAEELDLANCHFERFRIPRRARDTRGLVRHLGQPDIVIARAFASISETFHAASLISRSVGRLIIYSSLDAWNNIADAHLNTIQNQWDVAPPHSYRRTASERIYTIITAYHKPNS